MFDDQGGGKPPQMTAQEVNRFLEREFPQFSRSGFDATVETTEHLGAQVRLAYAEHHVRPGGTLSGPAMFALADIAMYACVLASYGPVTLAVTTNLNINFLRKPAQRDLIAKARLLKAGRRLAVGDVALYSEGEAGMVAHAAAAYAIPDEVL